MDSAANEYSQDIEIILESIRCNCIILHQEHHKRYLYLQRQLKFFKIPIIVLSSMSSLISFSQEFIPQPAITLTNALLSLTCSIIGSVELFIGVSSQMVIEGDSSKDFFLLAMDIKKVLTLRPENRSITGRAYLDQVFGTYTKLIEKSCVVRSKINDKLLCEIDSPPSSQRTPAQSSFVL